MKTKLLKQLRKNYMIVEYKEPDWEGYVVLNLKDSSFYYRDTYKGAVEYILTDFLGEKKYSTLKNIREEKVKNNKMKVLFNNYKKLKNIAP